MEYQLVIVRGRSASKILKLGNGVTTVGRQEDCQLRIGSSQVSRKHCQIYEKDGRLVVMDLGSSNGTFVNGKKVEGQQIVKSGDLLSFGKVKFRVERIDVSGKPRPADTAVAAADMPDAVAFDDTGSSTGSSDEFDIDFDEEVEPKATPPPPTTPAKDDTVKVAKVEKPAPAPAPAPKELADEAVADFLLNIDLEDEDKP
jgi:pSer/pThr/pTyr-binding forkhead associated (FHA) protein